MLSLNPVFLSGPSGVGKTYLEKYLTQNYPIKRFISTITRPPRLGEVDGVDYHFISEVEYLNRLNDNCFLTSVYIHNAWRGFEKNSIEQIIQQGYTPISVIVPSVVIQLKKIYPDSHALYLLPENEQLLVKRMRERRDTPQEIKNRLESSSKEIEYYFHHAKNYYSKQLVVTESNFEDIVREILCLIK